MTMFIKRRDVEAFIAFLGTQDDLVLRKPQGREVVRADVGDKDRKILRKPRKSENKDRYYMSDWLGCFAYRFYSQRKREKQGNETGNRGDRAGAACHRGNRRGAHGDLGVTCHE